MNKITRGIKGRILLETIIVIAIMIVVGIVDAVWTSTSVTLSSLQQTIPQVATSTGKAISNKINETIALIDIAAENPVIQNNSNDLDTKLDKLREITVESALNTPDTLPKPILLKLIARACDEKVFNTVT